MTPEELNRTVEFIAQSQARSAAAQEQDRVDRLESERELRAFDRRLANLLELQVRLLESQTARLDEYQRESGKTQKRQEQFQRRQEALLQGFRDEFLELMRGVRSSLDRILDKITDRLN